MCDPRPKRRLLSVRTPGRDLSLWMFGEGRQNLGLCSAPRALSREEGSLSCHTFYDKMPRFTRFHPKVHQFSCLSRQARGTEDLTYPDPNRKKLIKACRTYGLSAWMDMYRHNSYCDTGLWFFFYSRPHLKKIATFSSILRQAKQEDSNPDPQGIRLECNRRKCDNTSVRRRRRKGDWCDKVGFRSSIKDPQLS